jgi:tRNA pseudouridine55 synthase
LPSRDAIDRALDAFRGSFLQEPPAYSAKKIDGKRSYKLARAAAAAFPSVPAASPLRPRSVPVVVHRLELLGVAGDRVTLRVDCSAGFYVRSLADDLGARLGTGAHLTTLRRTRSGECTLAEALALEAAERDPDRAVQHVVPMTRMLRDLPPVVLTADGVRRATHGRDLGPGDAQDARGFVGRDSGFVRLVDPAGQLVGIARSATLNGLLHPSVVLV